ncbi:hypothetical protein [Polaribacter sp.]|uniref:hypothetical protein n=1 Tax=Polaribacter sp. TaxID=1920175 RepID=UPI0025F837F6|nr:hypothetical protein [Polaribacter sp.]
MFKRLNITCDEATKICDKSQYGEATVLEKIKLKIHFLNCVICKLYTKQNLLLSFFYKKQAEACKKVHHCLTSEEKEVLKQKIKEAKT